jgi:hypothetical protein
MVVITALTCIALSFPSFTFAQNFEVWLVDQSDSSPSPLPSPVPATAFGGKIYIYDDDDLRGKQASSATPTDVIDLAGDTATLCFNATGANPRRPHMLLFNSMYSHAILSFVASGHVVIFDAPSRTPLACFRTQVGSTGLRQAHAAFPAPDDSYILVANQNGKLLERITTDYSTNTFTHDLPATLDLATCTTPNGLSCQDATLRPNNVPICPIIDSSSQFGFVTLGGGGLFVVDATTTPITIVAEYDKATIHGNGCGGLEVKKKMYINSGAGAAATNPSEFDVYTFPLTGYDAMNPPNTPAPVVVFSDDLTLPDRDSHGMATTRRGKYIWVLDRARNVAEVFSTKTDAHLNTVDLVGTASGDPAPDLADRSPSGNRLFVSLRGPNPLSGDPHVATGSTPGLGIITMNKGGKDGTLTSVIPITNLDVNAVERADAHGVRVRRKH